jgi:two-component system sensor histidine kinase KdpD
MSDALESGQVPPQTRGSLLLREKPPSLPMGIAASLLAVAVTTALIYPLRQITPAVSNGVVYMLAVLLISTYWGLGLGLFTALASALAFNVFHIPPTGHITIADPQNYVALGVFLTAAAIASTVADLARARARDAERRREEADLAAELARLLLGEADLQGALRSSAHRLAEALELTSVAIELREVPGDDRRLALPLSIGEGREATLLVPAAIDALVLARLRERVIPSLEALLKAALDREELQKEVVETQALRYSDSMKTALLRAVSHDLRTPLTTILAGAAAVQSPSLSESEREELGESIGQQASRLSRLVDQLLDLSRLEAGTARPRRDWCSIEELIRAAVEQVDSDGHQRFNLGIDKDLPLVNTDGAQLERALVNLLENARRYSGGFPVKVRAGVVGGRLMIRIVDRGPGIPHRELERIFEPFYRGTAGMDDSGSGLGLAIARGFVEANEGCLTAESLPGQGTTFVIELPLAAPLPGQDRIDKELLGGR